MGDPVTTTIIVATIIAATAAVAISSMGGGDKDFGSGPRLTDLQTVQVSEGGKMWRAAGNRARTPGQIVFATKIHEKKSKQSVGSGKSAGSVTIYKYSVDIAVGIGQAFAGTDGKGAIEKLWEIRCNGKLIYNAKKKKKGKQRYISLAIKLGDEAQTISSTIADKYGSANVSAMRNTAYVVFNELKLADFGNQIPQVWEFVWQPDAYPYTVGDAITDTVLRVPGFTVDDIDVSNCTGENSVNPDDANHRIFGGMQYAGPTPATEILSKISLLYDLSVQETNGKMIFFDRGKEKVIEVLEEDLGYATGRVDVMKQPVAIRDRAETKLPSEIVLNYLDEDQHYKRASVRQKIDGALSGDNVLEYDAPFVLEREVARRIVRRRAFEPFKHRLELQALLPPKYFHAQEADILAIPFKGQWYYCYVVKKTVGSDWTLEFETVVVDVRKGEDQVLSSVSGSWNGDLEDTLNTLDPTDNEDPEDYAPPIVSTVLANLPCLTDEEASKPGLFFAHAAQDVDAAWIAAALHRATKSTGKYKVIGSESTWPEYVIGFAINALPDSTAKAGFMDRANHLDVQLFEGACSTLEKEEVLAGAHWLAVGTGNNYEILAYLTAEVIDAVSITTPLNDITFVAPDTVQSATLDFDALGVKPGLYIRLLGAQEEVNQDVFFRVVSVTVGVLVLDTATLVNETVTDSMTITQGSIYRLTNLFRGLRNTEDHCSQHTIGDNVIAFEVNEVLFLQHDKSEINKKRFFKDVPEGLELTDVLPIEFTSLAETYRPFSPASLRGYRAESDTGPITLSWYHRSRLTHSAVDSTTLHDLEPNEEWGKHGDRVKWQILVHSDADRTALVRSATILSATDHETPAERVTWTYTGAMQSADTMVGAHAYFTIRQIAKPPVTLGNPAYIDVE